MSDYIKDLIKATNNKLAAVASDGLYTDDISYIDTGSYMLNAMLSGDMYKGIPGRITMFAGPTSTGKTYLLLSIVKHFIEQDPENNVVFYFESEGAVNTNMLETRGINTKRLVLLPVSTLEEFRTQMLNVMKQYEERQKLSKYKILFCLDSLGMLSSSKEMEDTADGKSTRDMTKASLIKGIFRVLTLKLSELNMCLLVSNHVYAAIGSYFPTNIISGGSGAQYPMSQIIELSKRQDKEEKETIGVILKVKMHKSRITREGKTTEVLLNFSTGVNRYHGLLELAIKYGLFKAVTTRIELPDGTKTWGKTINKNPEKYFTADVMKQLNEFAHEEFMYGSGCEIVDVEEEEDDQVS